MRAINGAARGRLGEALRSHCDPASLRGGELHAR